MKPTVYVETSIFSALVARPIKDIVMAARQQTTRIWWQNDADHFELFASDIVQMEAREGDPEMAQLRLQYISSIPRLSNTREAERIADSLLDARILPLKARTDAMRLGIATLHRLQFIVSWNCKHLANGQIYRRVLSHLTQIGYNPPTVCTPSQLPGVVRESK
jgi:hypothetical protein